MTTVNGRKVAIAAFSGVAVLLFAIACDSGAARRVAIDKTQSQVERIVDGLDKRTTETGVYIRAKEREVREPDAWGRQFKIDYAQGGVEETVSVRSAGPDGEFFTNDDIVAQRMVANFKGVGEGVKKHAEETAANVAKGLVKGTVEGVKDSLPFRKKDKDDKPNDAPADDAPKK